MRIELTRVIVGAILLASASFAAGAQNYSQPPVSISKEKVTNGDGKIYYSHTVLERQTLYSIARAYGVTPDEICAANQDLHIRENGLKKGTIILIPCRTPGKDGERQAEGSAQASQNESPGGIAVAAGTAGTDETAGAATAGTAEAQDDGRYIIHTARWYEDLYDIAKKYSVPADVLKKYNGLSSYKLKSRQKVRIPLEYSPSEESPIAPSKESDTVSPEVPTESPATDNAENPDDAGTFISEARPKGRVNAALMLPFGTASGADVGYMDFYSGVLLAAEDLKKEGIDIDLRVYDTAGDGLPMTAERFAQEDIVIGPVRSNRMERLLSLPEGRAVAVSPLDQSTAELLDGHRNLLQAPPSMAVQYGALLNWLGSECRPGDKVIVISEKGAQPTSSMALLEQVIGESGLQTERFAYTILEGRTAVEHLTSIMTSSHTNRLIINSENEAFVNDAVRNLAMMLYRKFDVILYSQSKIRSYETIGAENLHSLSTRVAAPYFIDYDSRKVSAFLYSYRALFGTEPTQFSFQGYDIAYYMLSLIARYGDDWLGKLETDEASMMQTNFKFRRTSEDSGLLNCGIRKLIYNPDLSVSIIH